MKRFDILVRPDSAALLVGGQSAVREGGDKATARDLQGRLVIPASALRGALRIELERLLRSLDGTRGRVCNRVNEPDNGQILPPCGCQVCRLFGEVGGATGTLRLDDAVLENAEAPDRTLRPGVAIGRRTGTAVDRHLTLAETTGTLNMEGEAGQAVFRSPAVLVPRGPSDGEKEIAEDVANLRAACAALRGIGGGKSRGLGWVDCSIEETQAKAPTSSPDAGIAPLPEIEGLELRFEPLTPLHFGDGRPTAFFHRTLRHAPGSTVRGAIAFGLLENGVSPDDARFQALFGPYASAAFGSARLEGDVPSATRRKCRPSGHIFDDLAGELLRRGAAAAGVALAIGSRGTCTVPGCEATKLLPWPRRAGAPEPRLGVRTRTAINRLTGTAMDRKLYSLEVLEPVFKGSGSQRNLVLTAEVHGLNPETAALIQSLDGQDVWLGGKRARGMGHCRIKVKEVSRLDPAVARKAIDELAQALEQGWKAIRQRVPALRPSFLEDGKVPLAIVMTAPWSPDPIAPEAVRRGPLGHLELIDGFVVLGEEGRFGANEADRYQAPPDVLRGESPARLVVQEGSVFVYAVERSRLVAQLSEWLREGSLGTGVHQEQGWGRYQIRGAEPGF
jgi:CRISPR/Cas system CSM-associated protein Csm3 (group 7 of RAMP superfamily)